MNDDTVLLSWTQPVVAIWFSVIDKLQLISLDSHLLVSIAQHIPELICITSRTCQSDHMLLPTLGYKSHQEFHLGPSLYSLFLASFHYLLKQWSAAMLWAALRQGHIVRNIRYIFAMSFLGAISTVSVWGILRFFFWLIKSHLSKSYSFFFPSSDHMTPTYVGDICSLLETYSVDKYALRLLVLISLIFSLLKWTMWKVWEIIWLSS